MVISKNSLLYGCFFVSLYDRMSHSNKQGLTLGHDVKNSRRGYSNQERGVYWAIVQSRRT